MKKLCSISFFSVNIASYTGWHDCTSVYFNCHWQEWGSVVYCTGWGVLRLLYSTCSSPKPMGQLVE